MGRSSVDVQAEEQVKDALAERDVVVIFSKTYCGFCAAVKRLFERLGIRYRALELDILPLGSAMQRILYEMTGQRTVPSVWVRGRHLGGNDAVQELHRTGRLLPLLDESGIAHA
jgi:glutaredoxin 3